MVGWNSCPGFRSGCQRVRIRRQQGIARSILRILPHTTGKHLFRALAGRGSGRSGFLSHTGNDALHRLSFRAGGFGAHASGIDGRPQRVGLVHAHSDAARAVNRSDSGRELFEMPPGCHPARLYAQAPACDRKRRRTWRKGRRMQ